MLGVHTPSLAASYHSELLGQNLKAASGDRRLCGDFSPASKNARPSCCAWVPAAGCKEGTDTGYAACSNCCCGTPPLLAFERFQNDFRLPCPLRSSECVPSVEASVPGPAAAMTLGVCSCTAVRQFFSSDRLLLALDKGGNGVVSHWSSGRAEEGETSGESGESQAGDADCPPSSFFSLNLPIHRSESNPIITPLLSVVPATTGNSRLLSVYDLVTSSFVFYARPPAGDSTVFLTNSVRSVSPVPLTTYYTSHVPGGCGDSPDLAPLWSVGGTRRKLWMHAPGGSSGRGRAYACSASLPATPSVCISGTAWLPNLHPLLLAASTTEGQLLFYDLRASPHPFFVAKRPAPASWASSVCSASTAHSDLTRGIPDRGKHVTADNASSTLFSSPGVADSATSSVASAQTKSSCEQARPFSFITTVPWLTSASVPHDGVVLPCICSCCLGRAACLQGEHGGDSPFPPLASCMIHAEGELSSSSSQLSQNAECATSQEAREQRKGVDIREAGGEGNGEVPRGHVKAELNGDLLHCRGSTTACSGVDQVAEVSEPGESKEQAHGDCLNGVESSMMSRSEQLFRTDTEPVSIFTGCDASVVLKPRNCRRPRPTKRTRSEQVSERDSAYERRNSAAFVVPAATTCSAETGEEMNRRMTRCDSDTPNGQSAFARADGRGGARRSSADSAAEANELQEEATETTKNTDGGKHSSHARTNGMKEKDGASSVPHSHTSQSPRKYDGGVEEECRVAEAGPRKTRLAEAVTGQREGEKGWKAPWFSQEQRLFLRFATKHILSQRRDESSRCIQTHTSNTHETAVAPGFSSPHHLDVFDPLPPSCTERGSEEEREERASLGAEGSSALNICASGGQYQFACTHQAVWSSSQFRALDSVILGACGGSSTRQASSVSLLALAADLLRLSSAPSSIFTSFPSLRISLPSLSQPCGTGIRPAMASLGSGCSRMPSISHTELARSVAYAHLSMAVGAAFSGLLLSHRFDQHLVMSQLARHQQRQLLKLLHSRLPHASRPLTHEMAEDVARSLSRLHCLLEGKEAPAVASGDEAPASCGETQTDTTQTSALSGAPRVSKKRKQETSHPNGQRKARTASGAEPEACLLRSSDTTGFQDSSQASPNSRETANCVSPALASSIMRLYTQLFLASAVADRDQERHTQKGETLPAERATATPPPLSLVLTASGLRRELRSENLVSPLQKGQMYFLQNLLLHHYRNVTQVLRYAASALFVFGDSPFFLQQASAEPLSTAVKTIRAASLACSPCSRVAERNSGFSRPSQAGERKSQIPCEKREATPKQQKGSCDIKTNKLSVVGTDFQCGVCGGVESLVKAKMRRWLQEELEHGFVRVARRVGRQKVQEISKNASEGFRRDRQAGRQKMREIRALAKRTVSSLCLCELFRPASFYPSVLFNVFRSSGLPGMSAIQRNCMRLLPISDTAFYNLARAQDICVGQTGTSSLSVPLLASIQDRRWVSRNCGEPVSLAARKRERVSSVPSSDAHVHPSDVLRSADMVSGMPSPRRDFQNLSATQGSVSDQSHRGSVEEPPAAAHKKTERKALLPQSCPTSETETSFMKAETRRQQLFCVDAFGRASVLTVSLMLVPSRSLERSASLGRVKTRDNLHILHPRSDQEKTEKVHSCESSIDCITFGCQRLKGEDLSSETIYKTVGKLLKGDAEREEVEDEHGDTRIILCPSIDAKNDGLLEHALLKEKCEACCGSASAKRTIARPRRVRVIVAHPGNEENLCWRKTANATQKETVPENGGVCGGNSSRNCSGRKGQNQERRTAEAQKRTRKIDPAVGISASPHGNLWNTQKSTKEQSCEETANAFLNRLPILPVWKFPPSSVDSNASFLISSPSSELPALSTIMSRTDGSQGSSSLPTRSSSTPHSTLRQSITPPVAPSVSVTKHGRCLGPSAGDLSRAQRIDKLRLQSGGSSVTEPKQRDDPQSFREIQFNCFITLEEDNCFSLRGRSSRGGGGGATSSRVASMAVHENGSYIFLATSTPSFLLYSSSATLPPYRRHDRLLFGCTLSAHAATSLFIHVSSKQGSTGHTGPLPEGAEPKPLPSFVLPDAPGGPRPPPPLLLSAAPILPSHPSPPFLPHNMVRPFSANSLAPLYAGTFAAGTVQNRKAGVQVKAPSAGVAALGGKKGRDEQRETVFSDWLTEDDDDVPSDAEDDEESQGSG
ncbi:hypothetical protein TGVEG_283520 [Toxoplasma gondii VEG]|uniref:Uncharacterized protein n=2 Tax=Toxoplasma gondii TaxID=5811 RepID=B9QGN4_TOXGV|nr:hypothetical protein TGVEG_283520 [Toxoplasma gondii VEG]KFG28212.1 hypothetical protein TGP89_283520 [Toxoplasma gondii p89]CEL73052.1 TPA: hypothetical protein BN1205_031950 [Toxoplasma gondii VEG]